MAAWHPFRHVIAGRMGQRHPSPLSGSSTEQPHVHFTDGTAINVDGTIHDAGNGVPKLTNKVKKWLADNG